MPFRGPRRGRGPVALLALLAGCAAAPQPGWQAELANAYVDRTADFPVGERLLDGFDAVGAEPEPQVGDTLLYGLRLDTGGEPRVWYLRLRIDAIETKSWLEMREVLDFEERVSTPRVRQRRAEAEARWAAEGRPDFDSYRRDVPVARLRVEAFDAAGASLGAAESTESLYRLRIGLWSACVAGHARRELLRSLQGPDAPREVIDVEEAVYADVRCVADGVASCKSFFAILRQNPITKSILYEVIALPSLWSIVVNWGVRPGFGIDFAGAAPAAAGQGPVGQGNVAWLPMTIDLNDQPALLACLFVVAPHGALAGAAGVVALVGRHPTNPRRQVHVQLLASRRRLPR